MMNYLLRVRGRKAGLHRDELYELVDQAFDRLRHLNVVLHYRHIGHGVVQPSTESQPSG